MAPPKFDDLGKAASDLFKKGYEHGNVKLEVKSKAQNVDFTTKGTHNLAKKSLGGELESNWKGIIEGIDLKTTHKDSGVTDWEVTKMIPNAGKCVLTGSLNNSGQGFALGKLKQNYSQKNMNINLNSTLTNKPMVNLDAVVNFNNINAGFAVGYDVGSKELRSSSMGASFSQNNLDITLKSQCLKNEYNLLILNKAANNRTLAANINYAGNISMALAAKCTGLKHGSSQHKIDNNGILTNSFTTKFDGGCEATFSANVDCKNLQGAGHSLGAIFKFNL